MNGAPQPKPHRSNAAGPIILKLLWSVIATAIHCDQTRHVIATVTVIATRTASGTKQEGKQKKSYLSLSKPALFNQVALLGKQSNFAFNYFLQHILKNLNHENFYQPFLER